MSPAAVESTVPVRSARIVGAGCLGVTAAVIGGGAGLVAWQAGSAWLVVIGLAVHSLAAACACGAARLVGGHASERDLVVLLAVAVPVFGPAFAWLLAMPRAQQGDRNAHAAFESSQAEDVRRDEGLELERELQVVSHAQVLQHGSLEEKRNLLRQLARIGERRYLLLLRRFLLDPEPELRLCAYAELAKVCQEREERIGALRESAGAKVHLLATARAAAHAELAEAKRDYAASGLLDDDMAGYWFEQARDSAEQALQIDANCREAERVVVLALAELGDLDRAWAIASAWPADLQPCYEVARAELAFRRRDRGTCHDVAERLDSAGVELPPWLMAVVGRAVEEDAEVAAELERVT